MAALTTTPHLTVALAALTTTPHLTVALAALTTTPHLTTVSVALAVMLHLATVSVTLAVMLHLATVSVTLAVMLHLATVFIAGSHPFAHGFEPLAGILFADSSSLDPSPEPAFNSLVVLAGVGLIASLGRQNRAGGESKDCGKNHFFVLLRFNVEGVYRLNPLAAAWFRQ